MTQRILVWDIPTRVFHWTLALSFVGAYLTSESEYFRDIHQALGFVMLGLIGFRVIWGIVGTGYARFSSFTYSGRAVVEYVRSLSKRHADHYVGHNPAGAVAIFALLTFGVLTTISGVGLWWDFGGGETLIEAIEEGHELLSNLMLLIVLIHIAGVLVSSWLHKENLARAMFNGYKMADSRHGIDQAHLWLGLLIALSTATFLVVYLY